MGLAARILYHDLISVPELTQVQVDELVSSEETRLIFDGPMWVEVLKRRRFRELPEQAQKAIRQNVEESTILRMS